MPNQPVVNAGLKYCNGLDIAYATTTTLTMGAGAARNSSNVNDIVLSSSVTIDGSVVGANGVDVAAIGASSMYAVYVIGDSTAYYPTAAILSLNASAPVLPGAYDMYRRVGWVLTDGSSHFLKFYQYGNGEERTYYYDVGISELSGGSATSFTAIDLATSVPPLATQVIFDIAYTANSATNKAEFLPFGSAASNGIVRYGCGVAAAQVGSIVVPCKLDSSVPKVLYKVAASDALTLLTVGYVDVIS